MMSYHSRDKRKKKIKLFFIILFVLVLVFYSQITSVFNSALKFLIYPIWVTEENISTNILNPAGFLVSKKKLIIANEQLKKDIIEAEMMLADRNLLLKENLELKEIFGRRVVNDLLLASVLSGPSHSLYDSLVIDAGKNFDIQKENKLYAFGNILIGEVDSVDSKTSNIKLYSSPSEETEVLVGLFNVRGTAVGRGSGNFEIKLPRDVDVEIGDPVFIEGTNSSILGSVGEIIESPIDPFKILLLKSPVNLFELKWVQVLK